MTNRFEIIESPTKLALSQAVFDRKPLVLKVKVEPKGEGTVEVIINDVTAEDGSGESWTLKGFHYKDNAEFKAWLRTDENKGWIKFEAPIQQS